MGSRASANVASNPAARPSDEPQIDALASTHDGNEPIAVIGMSCRFPKAPGIEAFWKLVCNGVDAITEIPKERWDVGSLYSPDLAAPGKMNTRWGGFLEQIDKFDAPFFQISPREASQVDPQQRLMLELSWEALQDAGILPHSLQGSQTGVFFGAMWHDYDYVPADPLTATTQHTSTGQTLSVIPGRVSYTFGLRGPSIAFNTSCSSSLVAVHYARRSLQRAECSLALAGGVNIMLSPHATVGLSKMGALSADGRCKAFDARANGFVRSEGGGVVVLKPLGQALADGDRVYCVLLGSAINNNGANDGLCAPSTPAQEEVLQAAYTDAGISPLAVQYIETHGTGTALGDPTEARALGAVFGRDRSAEEPLLIGSVKTNLGHLETAAGIAGLIKVALALKHQKIPPNLHFNEPNPKIQFDALRLHVPTRLEPWPRPHTHAIAGVSSFGIGGTNGHLVVAAPDAGAQSLPADAPFVPLLLPLSAHSQAALKEQAGAMSEFLGGCDSLSAGDIAYTAGARRSHLAHRLAVVASTKQEWIAQLQAFAQDRPHDGLAHGSSAATGKRKLVFVFPGQGGQWLAMGKELLQDSPVFQEKISQCDKEMQNYCDFSLLEVLKGCGKAAELDRVDVVQPALFAMQVGLSAVLRSWGVEPAAVVGHSLGEVAAACVAGWLSLEEGCRIICERSKLVRRTSGQGAMALLELSAAQAAEALREYAGQVEVGAINGPRTTVISGDRQAVMAVMQKVEQAGGYCRLVKVDYASHSPQMEPLSAELLQTLAGVTGAVGQLAMYSTVSGEKITAPPGGEYWQRNLRQTVQFNNAVQALGKDGYDTYLEISPHPVLLPSLNEALNGSVPRLLTLGVMRREHGGVSELLKALGMLYVHGVAPSWPRLYPQPGRVVTLPNYPFQRTRHWIQNPASAAPPARPAGSHPLLGPPLQVSTEPGVRIFELELRLAQLPYLRDHRVGQAVVLPGAAYLEMARAAAQEVFKTSPGTLEEVRFQEMLTLDAATANAVQVVLHEEQPGRLRFAISSREEAAGAWRCHCRGRMSRTAAPPVAIDEELIAARRRFSTPLAVPEFYTRLSAHGLEYGPEFQRVTALFPQGAEALGRVQLDPQPSDSYGLHPALLDGCLQVILAALGGRAVSGPIVPIAIAAVHLHRPLPATVWSQVALHPEPAKAPHRMKADLRLFAEDGALVAALTGVELQSLARDPAAKTSRHLQHTWRPAALPSGRKPAQPGRLLLLADEGGVAEALRLRLQAKGESVELRPARAAAELAPLLKDRRYTAVVYLGSLDGPTGEALSAAALMQSADRDYGAVLEVLHALIRLGLRDPPRLWLLTRGVCSSGKDDAPLSPAGGILWGLGRTIAYEHPELACTRVDLSPCSFPAELEALEQELLSADQEEEVALRESGRLVARLQWQLDAPASSDALIPAAGRPFRLEIDTPGILDGLKLRPLQRRPPGPGEVEIEVEAASLNFFDVLMAMGIYPGQEPGPIALGQECTGKIVRVGPEVSGLDAGDPVIALFSGTFASHVTLPAKFVVPRPPSLSAAQAAAVSLALMTAYYGLHTLGRMKKGDRVLIHSAAGGTGLAAVQLALRAGAVVFATAGSADKRAYLQALGVEQVMDSRSLDFADEIRTRTGGRGVDIVLNSLTGPAIEKSLATLAPYGRFIELGKRDIYEDAPLNLGHFRKKLSYFAVDVAGMLEERTEETAQLLQQVVQEVGAGQLPPPQVTVFPITQAQAAVRQMAQGQHLGKLVLSLADPDARIAVAPAPASLRSDATYLITGGLGGLGLSLAKWMGAQGARHLLLLGRRGADSLAQQAAVQELQQTGMQVVVMRGDVSQRSDVEAALHRIATDMPALRGVVHAAGVLDDGLLANREKGQLAQVMAPKAIGAWNLHALTQTLELDFFVLYSSVAALLGSPGQSNYAAANSFVDALAHYRRARGLPALSINWGTFTDVGLAAAQQNRGHRLASRGMAGMTPDDGLAWLAKLLFSEQVQVGVVELDVRQWVEFYPQVAASSLLRELLQTAPAASQANAPAQALRTRLRSAADPERRLLLEAYLREQLGHVVRMNPAELDLQTPFKNLGVDSLMGLEFRNRLEAGLGLKLSAALIWTYPDIGRLAAHLSGRFAEDAPPPEVPAAPQADKASSSPDLDSLSDSELARLGDELLD